MPHHAGETGDQQCPHLDMLGPEIDRNRLEEHDNGDGEEQGVNCCYETICKVMRDYPGDNLLRRIVDREGGDDREHSSDDDVHRQRYQGEEPDNIVRPDCCAGTCAEGVFSGMARTPEQVPVGR